MHRIRVIKPEVGGGFGGKSDPLPHEIVCAALALETGRPVKILVDREDVFFTNHGRHPTQNDVRIAVDATGRLLAYDIEAVIDGGAWSSFGTVTTYYNGVLAMGPYRVPNFRYRGRRVYTTKPPSGAMRAHGGTNIRYSIEVGLDRLAEELKIDPFELRHRNALPPNSMTVNDFEITSTLVREVPRRVPRQERLGDEIPETSVRPRRRPRLRVLHLRARTARSTSRPKCPSRPST